MISTVFKYIKNLSEETQEIIIIIICLAHMAVITLKAMDIVRAPWFVILLPEIVFPLVCIAMAIHLFLMDRRK